MNRRFLVWILLAVVLLIGFVLRFYLLGSIPIALNRDEAALGYTAWSIIHTGRDEHGVYYPINVQSFGDWKLPVYIYTLIPFIKLFGLTEWSVRVVSALSGLVIIGLTFLISKLLTDAYGKKEVNFKYTNLIPIVSALFVAISPWAIHISRIAYEANLALALFMIAVAALLYAVKPLIDSSGTATRDLLLVISSVLFGLTLFTYHAYQIFTPLFCFGLLYVYWSELRVMWHKNKTWLSVAMGIFTFFSIMLIISQSSGANETKYSGITVFSENQYEQLLFETRQQLQTLPDILSKLYVSMPKLVIIKIVDNLMSVFNPIFLFQRGGTHGSHNFPGFGNLYWFGLITLPIGLYVCVKYINRSHAVLLLWIAAALVAPLITSDAAHSIRFSPALVPLEMISALGLLYGLFWISNKNIKIGYVAISVAIITIVYSTFLFAVSYFVLFPIQGVKTWPWYMKQIVDVAMKEENKDKTIYMQGESSSPYIWFLFYDPEKFSLSELDYYPSSQGFVHGKRVGRINFGDINWSLQATSSASALYIVRPQELTKAGSLSKNFINKGEIINLNSLESFVVLERKSNLL